MGYDTSELFGGEAMPADSGAESTIENESESDAGTLDVPQHETSELVEGTEIDTGTTEEVPTGRKQLVPLGALQEERTKRQEREAELNREREANRVLQERFNQFLMQQQQQQAPQQQQQEQQVPNFIDDPEGYIKAREAQLEQRMAQFEQYVNGTAGQQQAQQQHVQLTQRVTADEQAFAKDTPDYKDATTFFTERKLAEYATLGLDPTTASQQLARDYTGIAQLAYKNGKNPAEVMYNLAKTFGFQAGQQQQQQQQQKKTPPTSLSSLDGVARAPDEKGKLTAARIAEMNDKEFDEFFASMSKGSHQKIKF